MVTRVGEVSSASASTMASLGRREGVPASAGQPHKALTCTGKVVGPCHSPDACAAGVSDVSEGDALPGRVLPGSPPHPQGGQGEGAEEYDDSDDQQVQQAFGDHADDAQRDRCDY